MSEPTVTLQPGRERSLERRHPWLFSGAVARVEGDPAAGDTVLVRTADGGVVGRGAYSPRSQIRVRMWSFDPAERVDVGLFRRRLAAAAHARRQIAADPGRDAWRLVHGESDGLPGILVDRYGEFLVCQLLAAGAEARRGELLEALAAEIPARGVWERSDQAVREREGLPQRVGRLAGEEPPAELEVREGPCRFLVDLRRGHKTGFYLDQAENRARLAADAAGARLLDAFSFSGGFGLAALAGGADRVTWIDSSSAALATARRQVERAGLDAARTEALEGDAFQLLRRLRAEERRFDRIVLDPPKFADSRGQVRRAARGYKDINLLACQLLAPAGRLYTFSCSGALEASLFQKIVADAALDAGRRGRILARLGAAPDHPVALPFPEGEYLKGLVVELE